MRIDDTPSPLTMAATLLRNYGVAAPLEAMERSKDYNLTGDIKAAAFWAEVTREALDAVTAMMHRRPK
jgi:hypothetical protein